MPGSLRLTGCTVDLDHERVLAHDGAEVRLTTREAELLRYLADRPSEPVAREVLLREVWGYADDVVSRTADNTVRRLREKIEVHPSDPVHVVTVFGVGYRFEPVQAPVATPAAPPPEPRIRVGHAWVDLRRQRVEVDGDVRYLTATEAAVLEVLLARAGEVVSRAELLRQVWRKHTDDGSRAVDVTMGRLRSKIERDPSQPSQLLTVRGTGYQLDVGVAAPVVSPDPDLVGRDADLAALEALLAHPGVVSVVGPPGVGKSRLARAAAGRWPSAVFVPLGGARTADDAERALCAALGVSGDEDVAPAVARALAGRGRTLLVLDDADLVAAALGPVVAAVGARAGEARVLVTSRARLGAERVYDLGPLALADAVALFEARARAPGPGRDPARDAVARIVELVDRLPLAIELAAARTAVLGPPELLERLERGLGLLASPRAAADDRHATLRRAVAWSWDLLGPHARRTLAQLTLFRGGFTLEAAEQVVDLGDEGPEVVDVLQSLRDASLVAAHPDPHRAGAVRMSLYRAVAEVAAQDLPVGARGRFVAWCAGFGADAAIEALARHGCQARLLAMSAELDNLLAGVGEAADAEPRGRCALAATRVLELRGPFPAGAAVGEAALGRPLPEPLTAELALSTARCHRACDRFDASDAVARRGLAAAEAVGGDVRARLLLHLGLLCIDRFRHDEARPWLEASAVAAHAAGSAAIEHTARARLARLDGETVEAERHLGRALRAALAVGDAVLAAHTRATLARLAWLQGRLGDAVTLYDQAIDGLVEVGDRQWELRCWQQKASVLLELGRFDAHREARTFALEAFAASGRLAEEAQSWMELGHALRIEGRLDAAREALQRVAPGVPLLEDRLLRGYHALRVAEWHLAAGDPVSARHHAEAALAEWSGYDFGPAIAYTWSVVALARIGDDLVAARVAAALAVDTLRALGTPFDLGIAVCRQGHVALADGRYEQARQAVDEAESLRRRTGAGPRSQLAQEIDGLRAAFRTS